MPPHPHISFAYQARSEIFAPRNRNICNYGYLTVSEMQFDGREAGLDLIIGDFGEMWESVSQGPATENIAVLTNIFLLCLWFYKLMWFSLVSIRATIDSEPSSSDGTIDPVPVEYRQYHWLKAELTWKFQVWSAETY